MLIAHPDDDAIFGFHDLLNNDCTVICLTNGEHPIRANEFKQCMALANAKGHILNYPDTKRERWAEITNLMFFKEMRHLLDGPYDAIVSHDASGEYGHKHHKRVHVIASFFSKRLGVPFYGFQSRFSPNDYGPRHDALLAVYVSASRAVQDYKYFYSRT